jgi:hypothetical protein
MLTTPAAMPDLSDHSRGDRVADVLDKAMGLGKPSIPNRSANTPTTNAADPLTARNPAWPPPTPQEVIRLKHPTGADVRLRLFHQRYCVKRISKLNQRG